MNQEPKPYTVEALEYYLRVNAYKPSRLIEQVSPSLPMNFDRRLLPENICERQAVKMMQCQANFRIEPQSGYCQQEMMLFQRCKTSRDSIIFDRIKEWETKHYQNLSKDMKQLYVQGMTNKLNRMTDTLDALPALPANETKAKIIEGEIEQMKWRMRYLRKIQ